LPRESGSGQDVSEVRSGILFKKLILLTAGNTSSLVIDRLCDQAREEDITVAGFYCDYLAQQEQTAINVMGAILKQLVGSREIPDDIREAFQEGKKGAGGRRPRLADLTRMLRVAIASLPQVFICIDGLDECLPKVLPELLQSLSEIVRDSPKTRIYLTGRPHVTEAIQRYFTKAVVIPISPNQDDIRNYLEMRIDRDDKPEAMNNGLRADIVRIIVEKMPDMCVGVSPLPTMYTDQRLCLDSSRFVKNRGYFGRDDNSSEKKETSRHDAGQWAERCLHRNANPPEGAEGK